MCINVSFQNVQNTVYVLRNRLAKQLVLLDLENSLQDYKRPSHPSLFVLIIIKQNFLYFHRAYFNVHILVDGNHLKHLFLKP